MNILSKSFFTLLSISLATVVASADPQGTWVQPYLGGGAPDDDQVLFGEAPASPKMTPMVGTRVWVSCNPGKRIECRVRPKEGPKGASSCNRVGLTMSGTSAADMFASNPEDLTSVASATCGQFQSFAVCYTHENGCEPYEVKPNVKELDSSEALSRVE